MPFIFIYTTHKNQQEADGIVNALLQKKLIACANFYPIMSRYVWKGAIENSEEVVAILKTRTEKWFQVKEYIESVHPYEVPCIVRLAEVEANGSYEEWIQNETRNGGAH